MTFVANPRNCDFTPLASTTVGASYPSIWADIGDGTPYVSNSSLCTSLGNKTLDLTSSLLPFNSHRTANWIGIGLKYSNETRDSVGHSTRIPLSSSTDTYEDPVLVVDYTMPSDSQVYATVYADTSNPSTEGIPRYREWNPSSLTWSSEVPLPDTGSQIRGTWIAYNPVATNRISVLTLSHDGTFNFFHCSGSCTASSNWQLKAADFADVVSGTGNLGGSTVSAANYAAIAYEQNSGDLLLIYSKDISEPNDVYYRTYSQGGVWGQESGYNVAGGASNDASFCCVLAKSKPGSDEITAAVRFIKLHALIWNGNSFTNQKEINDGSNVSQGLPFDVGYEKSSGASMVFAKGAGYNNVTHARWNGTGWSALGSTDFNSAGADEAITIEIASNPITSSNKLMVCVRDSLFDMNCAQVDAGVVGSRMTIHTSGSLGFEFAYEPQGDKGVVLWQASQENRWKIWNGTGFSGTFAIPQWSSWDLVSGGLSSYTADSYRVMFLIQYRTGVGAAWYDGNGIGSFGVTSHSPDTYDVFRAAMAIAAKPG